MASLVDELLAVQTRKGPDCGVKVALDTLPPGIDREELEAAIFHPSVRFTTLASWAKDHGIRLTSEALSRHRRGECRCR